MCTRYAAREVKNSQQLSAGDALTPADYCFDMFRRLDVSGLFDVLGTGTWQVSRFVRCICFLT
jgi:hypothetical protein